MDEIKQLKTSIQPGKKTVKVAATGHTGKSELSEAVKHNCSKENKFAIVDWVQRTFDKRTADEVSVQIGLAEAKAIKKKLKPAERSDTAEEKGGEHPIKKLKEDDKKNTAAGTKSPIKQSTN